MDAHAREGNSMMVAMFALATRTVKWCVLSATASGKVNRPVSKTSKKLSSMDARARVANTLMGVTRAPVTKKASLLVR